MGAAGGTQRNGPDILIHDCKAEHHFKIVLIGDSRVGKTSIFMRYVKNQFDVKYTPSVKPVVENVVKKVNLPDNIVCSVSLWDTPGSEDIDLRDSYYRNVDAAIVVVDMTDRASIELAGSWKQDFANRVSRSQLISEVYSKNELNMSESHGLHRPHTVPTLLLGNKYDLVEEDILAEKLSKMITSPLVGLTGVDKETDKNTCSDDDDDVMDIESRDNKSEVIRTDPGDRAVVDPERIITPQRGPRDTDAKPDCVRLLETVGSKYDFVGSVMVSASDGDESVYGAIQSLVRFLITKTGPARTAHAQPDLDVRISQKRGGHHGDGSLICLSGDVKLDKVLKRLERPLRGADDYVTYYQLALKRFKQTCADLSFLEETRPSLEDCILAVRDRLRQDHHLSLEAEDDESFLCLFYKEDHKQKIAREIPLALEVFHKEFAALCKTIGRDGPRLLEVLSQLDQAVVTAGSELRGEGAGDGGGGDTAGRTATLRHACDKNRARIAFAKSQVHGCLDNVRGAYAKVKAALIW